RVLVPGTPAADAAAAVDSWAAERGVHAERIHAAGGYAYDATFRDIAEHEGNALARASATGIEYPTRDLELSGPEWRVDLVARPLALGLIGLGGLLAVRSGSRRRLSTR